MTYQDIIVERVGRVERIMLNKPDKLNAMSWSTMAEIESAVQAADGDDAVRAIVITAKGRGFSTGMDLTDTRPADQWSARPERGRQAVERSRHLVTARIFRCRKPVIAAVNGIAAGAGLSLALACDIRIASEAAQFSAIFIKRATVADTGTSWFLPRLIGTERALRMMWSGRMVPADEALAIGLVSEVVPAAALDETAMALAQEIALGPALPIELDKSLVHDGQFRSLEDQIEKEEYAYGLLKLTADFQEGHQSFLEKRAPLFEGR